MRRSTLAAPLGEERLEATCLAACCFSAGSAMRCVGDKLTRMSSTAR